MVSVVTLFKFFQETTPFRIIVLFVIIGIAINGYSYSIGTSNESTPLLTRHNDFFEFWSMSKAIWSGLVDRIYDVKAFVAYQLELQDGKSNFILPNFYPPSFLFFVLPLSLGPFVVMAHLWIFGTLALFATLGQGGRWSRRRALVLLAAPSTMVTMAAGQTGFLTAALLGGGLGLLRTHPIAAGICLGLVTIKPHLALLAGVALLAARAWRAIGAAALTFAILAGASAAAFGPGLWLDWVRVLPQAWEMNLAAFGHLGGFMPTVTGALLKLGAPLALAKTVQTVATLACLGLVWIVYRRPVHSLQPALAMSVVLLATPYAQVYDMAQLTLAVVLLAEYALSSGRTLAPGERLGLFAAWVCPFFLILPPLQPLPVALLAQIGLAALICRRLWAASEPVGLSPAQDGPALTSQS